MTPRAQAGPPHRALSAGALAVALLACHGHDAAPRAPTPPAAAAPPAPAPGTAAHAPASPAPAPPARLVVAVAELAGDPGQRVVKERVLAHLRALAPGVATGPAPGLLPDVRSDLAIEVLDVPHGVLAPGDAAAASDDSPFAILQHGHDRARALLTELRASALIWGTAGAAPVLYVTTAESADSSQGPCADPAANAGGPRHALCALDTGATWLLCATTWAELVPVGCAPAP